MKKEVGKTKDSGFQFGIRRTVDVPQEEVWDFMFSLEGLAIWLGILEQPLVLKTPYQTEAGVRGEVRVFKALSHIRMSWHPADWNNSTTLQIRIIPKKGKTTISFHQDKLTDAQQRAAMKEHWTEVIMQLKEKFSSMK